MWLRWLRVLRAWTASGFTTGSSPTGRSLVSAVTQLTRRCVHTEKTLLLVFAGSRRCRYPSLQLNAHLTVPECGLPGYSADPDRAASLVARGVDKAAFETFDRKEKQTDDYIRCDSSFQRAPGCRTLPACLVVCRSWSHLATVLMLRCTQHSPPSVQRERAADSGLGQAGRQAP